MNEAPDLGETSKWKAKLLFGAGSAVPDVSESPRTGFVSVVSWLNGIGFRGFPCSKRSFRVPALPRSVTTEMCDFGDCTRFVVRRSYCNGNVGMTDTSSAMSSRSSERLVSRNAWKTVVRCAVSRRTCATSSDETLIKHQR